MSRSPEAPSLRTEAPDNNEETPLYVQPELPFDTDNAGDSTPEAHIVPPADVPPRREAATPLPDRGTREERLLAAKLNNPELKSTQHFKNDINRTAMHTINGIETAYHQGRDVTSEIKTRYLQAKAGRSIAKKERLETKRDATMFRFRRKHLEKKLVTQEKIIDYRKKEVGYHADKVKARHDRRIEARAIRYDAYKERRSEYLRRASTATERKMRRHYERLSRQQRALLQGERSPATTEQIAQLEKRKQVIRKAVLEARNKKQKQSEMGLAA